MAKPKLELPQIENPTAAEKEMLQILHRELGRKAFWERNPLKFLCDAISRRRLEKILPHGEIRLADEYTWEVNSPSEFGSFLGHPVQMCVEVSYDVWGPGRWLGWRRPVSKADCALIDSLQSHLRALTRRLEEDLQRAESATGEQLASSIGKAYFSFDNDPDRPPNQWSFVVEKSVDASFGWHFVFEDFEMTDSFERGI